MKTEIIEICGLKYQVPMRRSQYFVPWVEDCIWRRNASPKQLGRMKRWIEVGTFLSYQLRGNAKKWSSSYYKSLMNTIKNAKIVG